MGRGSSRIADTMRDGVNDDDVLDSVFKCLVAEGFADETEKSDGGGEGGRRSELSPSADSIDEIFI